MKLNVKNFKKAANITVFENYEYYKNIIKDNSHKPQVFDNNAFDWYDLYADDEFLKAAWNVYNLPKFCSNEYRNSKVFEYEKILFEHVKKYVKTIADGKVRDDWQDNVKKFRDRASKKYYFKLETLLDGCFMFWTGTSFYTNMFNLLVFHMATNCSVEWEEIENLLRDNMWILGNCAGVDKFKGVKAHSNTDELKANYDENKVIPEVAINAWYWCKKNILTPDKLKEIDFISDACMDFDKFCELYG